MSLDHIKVDDLIEAVHWWVEVNVFWQKLHFWKFLHSSTASDQRLVVQLTLLTGNLRSYSEYLSHFEDAFKLDLFKKLVDILCGTTCCCLLCLKAFVDKRLNVNAQVQPSISPDDAVGDSCMHRVVHHLFGSLCEHQPPSVLIPSHFKYIHIHCSCLWHESHKRKDRQSPRISTALDTYVWCPISQSDWSELGSC